MRNVPWIKEKENDLIGSTTEMRQSIEETRQTKSMKFSIGNVTIDCSNYHTREVEIDMVDQLW